MDIAALIHELSETIGRTGQARAVFGDPLKLDTQSIIPVAVVISRIGGGGGGAQILGGGGGGGFRLDVLPVGFIHETDGVASFTALDLPLERLAQLAEGSKSPQTPKSPKTKEEAEGLLAQLRQYFGQS